MAQVIHMQSTRKNDGPGTPIHRLWTKWHGDPHFQTTLNESQVTCKMCLGMLSRQKIKVEAP